MICRTPVGGRKCTTYSDSNMPWRSDQQRKWGHTPEGEKALGGPAKVAEWDRATKGMSLPHRVGSNMDKFSSRPRPAQYLRGGPVQAEKRSWAKLSAPTQKGDMLDAPDHFSEKADTQKQSYGKSPGTLGSMGKHGPNCSCATCKGRWGS